MKKIRFFITALIAATLFTGCFSGVDTVKDGTLNFDNSITVGQAFDRYKYFSSTKWRDFETDNGRKIVEVTGNFTDEYIKMMKWDGKFSKASTIVQFKINKDDTFEISAIAIDLVDLNGKPERADLGKTMSQQQLNNFLRELYNNNPLS